MMPTVSVVIPTYNRSRLLIEALESVMGQTRLPEEIIVVDDGSTDDTEKCVKQYGEKIIYIRQKNSRQAVARNRGIQVASGEFIALLDSDDLWVSTRLEDQLRALALHPELDLVFGLEAKFNDEHLFNDCEIKEQEVLECLRAADCLVNAPFELLLRENFIPTSSVIFRRSSASKVGDMDSSVEPCEDYDFWLRFAKQGFQFGFVNSIMSRRRMHSGNLVNHWVKLNSSLIKVLTRYRDDSPVMREYVYNRLCGLHYDLGSRFLYEKKYSQALDHLRQASPSGLTRLTWNVKLLVAWLLGR